jgi:2-dehydro-3-deoxyphosphogluconate aldolase/(4S)-4-hydroxy-2-oxoglutarate aldolase
VADGDMDLLAQLRQLGVVPVIVIDDPAKAGPLAEALSAGGLPLAEITYRTGAAGEAIRRIAADHADVLVGAGTVLTPEQVTQARDAGAKFIVSPGFNRRVVDRCRELGLSVYPGVCTPTEIEAALEAGLGVVKFFPAEAMGGVTYLEAIAAPYAGIEFIPTGGVTADNLPRYLGFGRVVACGGSWMAPKAWIAAGDYARIRAAVRRAVDVVQAARAGG